jgi:hypothetical protein
MPADTETKDAEEPDVYRIDNGKDWKELDEIPVFARRYSAKAVLDAIELANELISQTEIDNHADSLKTPNRRSERTAGR